MLVLTCFRLILCGLGDLSVFDGNGPVFVGILQKWAGFDRFCAFLNCVDLGGLDFWNFALSLAHDLQLSDILLSVCLWIPACAGMTGIDKTFPKYITIDSRLRGNDNNSVSEFGRSMGFVVL